MFFEKIVQQGKIVSRTNLTPMLTPILPFFCVILCCFSFKL
nr:MAG TPA: hypothetical protein [Caudoviricetes sp.]